MYASINFLMIGAMNFRPQDIAQLDPYSLVAMDKEELLPQLTKIIADLKEAMDRLNQNSSNSSRPSSSDSPWGGKGSSGHDIDWVGETLQEMLNSSSSDHSQTSDKDPKGNSECSLGKGNDASQDEHSLPKKKALK